MEPEEPEVAEPRAADLKPPWNDESFDTSEGGVERPSEVLAEEQILPPEPEAKKPESGIRTPLARQVV